MNLLDWLVLLGTSLAIIGSGLWLHRRQLNSPESFLRGNTNQGWLTVGLSVMATQASAITFLSVPGQAYEDGMRFVQIYFGLPLAMVFISIVLVPAYFGARVYTAYEWLEERLGLGARVLGASLFLFQRGLAAGMTLYAPAIVLTALLGWPLEATIWGVGGAVILYTVTGGASMVAHTQKQQMVVMLGGMALCAVLIAHRLPADVSVSQALHVSGALGRMQPIRTEFNFHDRYNLWSGLIGGFFLSLSYFGTDQSQVARYLSARSVAQSRLGLMVNAVLKIPMQALILLVGVLVFSLHQFETPPWHFNQGLVQRARGSAQAAAVADLDQRWQSLQQQKQRQVRSFLKVQATLPDSDPTLQQARQRLQGSQEQADSLRKEGKVLLKRAVVGAETKDSDYIFLSFVQNHLPHGVIGLLVAVILFAAMGSAAGELSALGQTTALDLWQRLGRPQGTDQQKLRAARICTAAWGGAVVVFASLASMLDNLIQAINIIGSLFYGVILGIFLCALWLRQLGGRAVVLGALLAQGSVIALFFATDIGFLWYNLIGCALVVLLSALVRPWVGGSWRPPLVPTPIPSSL